MENSFYIVIIEDFNRDVCILNGVVAKRAALTRGMNYYVVFVWNRWWIFCGVWCVLSLPLSPCKNSLNYWLFCTTNEHGWRGPTSRYSVRARRRPAERIHYRNARHTFRDCSDHAGRNGEIKRILDFSIKILFGWNSRHARAFHKARARSALAFPFFFSGAQSRHERSEQKQRGPTIVRIKI